MRASGSTTPNHQVASLLKQKSHHLSHEQLRIRIHGDVLLTGEENDFAVR